VANQHSGEATRGVEEDTDTRIQASQAFGSEIQVLPESMPLFEQIKSSEEPASFEAEAHPAGVFGPTDLAADSAVSGRRSVVAEGVIAEGCDSVEDTIIPDSEEED